MANQPLHSVLYNILSKSLAPSQKIYVMKNHIQISDSMIHEDRSKLSAKTQDMTRAIDSLREELEAVDWYNQRADACTDKNLKKILIHNANEEKEHAAMLIEWIRQHDENFATELKDYLFSEEADIASLED
jgi:ferritin-like protein